MIDHRDLVSAAAANLTAWHDANLRAHGLATAVDDGVWHTPDAAPVIYFSAIRIAPRGSAAVMVDGTSRTAFVAACDPWSDLDLAPRGFQPDGDHPWMVRPGDGPWTRPAAPAGLEIEPVVDARGLDEFERTAERGFGMPAQGAGTWHDPRILLDHRMQAWIGRVERRPVAVSMSYVSDGVVGVYGVATEPDARGRGYGSAMTWQAIAADPMLPSVLQPSELAISMYERIGFRPFARFRHWRRNPR